MFHIEGIHDKRRIVTAIAIRPPDAGTDLNHLPGRALVDTGESTSGIKARVARRLGLRSTGKRTMMGLHGEGHVDQCIFQIGFIPDAREYPNTLPFYFDEVDGFELKDSFQFDALIGMDILCQCDLAIYRNKRWRLSFGYGA
jgi:hypothetical protein